MSRFIQWFAVVLVVVVLGFVGTAVYREQQRPRDHVVSPPPFVPSLAPSTPKSSPPQSQFQPTLNATAQPPASATTKPASPEKPAEPKPPVARKGTRTWQEVEAMLVGIRESRKESPSAGYDLSRAYLEIADPAFTDSADYPTHCVELGKWRDELPESPSPLIALANAHVEWAWQARGIGLAFTVTEEGWNLFHTRIDEAGKLIEAAIKRGPLDGEVYRLQLLIGMAESWPDDRMQGIFDAGRALDPTYYLLYQQMAQSLLPKWGGAPGAAERFVAEVTDLLPGDNGLEFHGMLVEMLNREDYTKLYWGNYDREKLRGAARVLFERFPQRQRQIQFAALLAYVLQDQELGRRIEPHVGEADLAVWLSPNRLIYFKDWCESKLPADGERARCWGAFSAIQWLAFAPNSQNIWCPSGGSPFPIHLINASENAIQQQLVGPGLAIRDFSFSPGQNLLAAAAQSPQFQGIVVWNTAADDPPQVFAVEGKCSAVSISPIAPLIAIHDNKQVRIVSLESQQDVQVLPIADESAQRIFFSPNGKYLACWSREETAIFDIGAGSKVYSFSKAKRLLNPDIRPHRCLSFDDQQRLLCLASGPSGSTGIARFSVDGATHEMLIPGPIEPTTTPSLDGKLLAVANDAKRDSKSIDIWSLESKLLVQRLPAHALHVLSMAFSGDGKQLATAAAGGEIKIWDIKAEP